MRGQSYDGAPAMAGGENGTQAFILKKQPKAVYAHCRSHVLNLSIAASCRIQEIRNLIYSINKLFNFFDNSPKRQRYLENVLQTFATGTNVTKLKGLCKTRLVERHECYKTLYSLYEYVVTCTESIAYPDRYPSLNSDAWDWDRDTIVTANGLATTFKDFTSIVVLVILCNALLPVRPLTLKLQKEDKDVYRAYKNVDEVCGKLQTLRDKVDEMWKEWYEEVEKLAEEVGSEPTKRRNTKIQCNRTNVPAETPRYSVLNIYIY